MPKDDQERVADHAVAQCTWTCTCTCAAGLVPAAWLPRQRSRLLAPRHAGMAVVLQYRPSRELRFGVWEIELANVKVQVLTLEFRGS
eukprot:6973954-Prymnesium_polylepis.1